MDQSGQGIGMVLGHRANFTLSFNDIDLLQERCSDFVLNFICRMFCDIWMEQKFT
jgi:hypothetical protein